MRRIERYIGWRYLVSKRSIRFINVIGIVSVAGITVGVAALLVALSVFNGFNSVVTSVLVGFDPHLRIGKQGPMSLTEYAEVEKVLRGEPGIAAFAPYVSGKAMLTSGYIQRVVYVRGIDPAAMASVTGIPSRLVLGKADFGADGDPPGVIIGIKLADDLRSLVGSEIGIVSPSGLQPAITGAGAPRQYVFRVAGIYESENKEYDAGYAFVSLGAARDLFGMRDEINGIDLRVTGLGDADAIKASLMERLPAEFTVSTWYDLHRSLYSVMEIERWSAYILLSLIIAVASFNVLGSLTMSVLEKRRDIAVLRSCGLPRGSIVRIFLFEGLLTGAAWTVAGILLGLLVVWLQMEYRLFPLDPTIYIIPAIPVELRLGDFISVAVASMGISSLAALYPARRAAGIEPAEALRWE